MAVNRTQLIRGPARLLYNSQTIFSKSDIRVNMNDAPFNVDTDLEGTVDVRTGDRLGEVSFTPAGEFYTALKPVYWPLSGSGVESFMGQSVFGGTDTALQIMDPTGRTVTFTSAKVVRMPNIIFSATKTFLGDVTFSCVGQNNTDWTGSGSFITNATGGSFSATGFSSSTVKTEGVTIAWGGAAPWSNVLTPEGVTVSFDLETQPVMEDVHGTVDYTYGNLVVRCSMTMLNASEQDLLAIFKPFVDGGTAGRGKSLFPMAQTLTLTTSYMTVTMNNVIIDSPPTWRYQRTSPRLVDFRFRTVAQPGAAIFTLT